MDLEQLLQDKIDTRVFLDTCTLMHPKFEKFLAKVVPVYLCMAINWWYLGVALRNLINIKPIQN